jgi:hypothetical protein
MATVEELLERSVELKHELLAFLREPRVSREFEAALHRRYGEVITGSDDDLASFFDTFLLGHRLSDGRTPVERFVRARGDLSRADRDLMLGWVDPLESVFEAGVIEAETLSALNLVDELTYPIRSNMGLKGLERLVPGTVMAIRLVPVLDQWMITGPLVAYPPEDAGGLLRLAAKRALTHSEATCRNPGHRQAALEVMRERRAAFVSHFGTDLVTVPGADLERTLHAYWDAAGDLAVRHDLPPGLTGADTVGVIFDPDGGLGYYEDFGQLWSAFDGQHPDRATLRLVRDYLESPRTSPLPLRRCVAAHPDRADAVIGAALGRRAFSWERDGEALLRRHKPRYDGRPHPGVSIVSERLRPYLGS